MYNTVVNRKIFLAILAALLNFRTASWATDDVSVYRYASKELAGRTQNRNSVLTLELDQFKQSESLPVPNGEGMLTAVVLDARCVDALEFLTRNETVTVDGTAIEKVTVMDGSGYRVVAPAIGLEVAFIPEKPNEAILAQVDMVYANNLYWRRVVREHYLDNYVLRILNAENIIDGPKKTVDFIECMVMATLLGDSDQWLWGIHDGFGIFEDLTFEVGKRNNWYFTAYDNYRDFETNEAKMYNRIHSIEDLEGDFVENLAEYVKSRTVFTEFNETIIMPEVFIETGFGSGLDAACFYFDVLKRKRMNPKLIRLPNPGTAGPALRMPHRMLRDESLFFVVYKPDDAKSWSAVTWDGVKQDLSPTLSGLSFPLFGMPLTLTDVDTTLLFEGKRLQ